ncbi:MAG: arylamine N-acetyltransferase [Burkholderiaceae bacterium]|jgi:N-hydroxyarylamine O-acetyltransferase
MIDLKRYFDRVGYAGEKNTTVQTLVALHEAHAGAIPFENIDVLRGLPVSVRLSDVEAKLVGAERGGYCFEQATLFRAVLEALGFRARIQLARVRWADGRKLPRSHMVLCVETDEGPYLADVGFGGRGLLHPIPFAVQNEHSSADGCRYRLAIEEAGDWVLEGDIGRGFEPHYGIARSEATPEDIEMANFYVSTSPQSIFRSTLVVQRLRRQRRALLVNRSLSIRANGQTTLSELSSDGELREVLADEFGLRLDPGIALSLPSSAGA